MMNFRIFPASVFKDRKVCVVMPARDEEKHIHDAIRTLPDWVDEILVVDDGSKDDTARIAKEVGAYVINSGGIGVGGAIATGYKHLVDSEIEGRWCAVVMAGDGQMDANDLHIIIGKMIEANADFVKGDRSSHQDGLTSMPLRRRLGTWWLKHLTNLASGLKINDPQCGYTVCQDKMLRKWDFNDNWDGYGYPNWWLLSCVEQGFSISEAPVKAIYEGQKSGIRISKFMPKVSLMLLTGLLKRGSRWYVLGQKKISLFKRLMVSLGFFGGLAAIASIPWIGPIGISGIVGLIIARYVDHGVVVSKSTSDKVEAQSGDGTTWSSEV